MSEQQTTALRRLCTGSLTVLVALCVGGCANADPVTRAAPPTTSAPTSAPDDPGALLAELVVQGGMCVAGSCGFEFTVLQDGRWHASGAAEAPDDAGTLEDGQLEELRTAVAETTLGAAPPFTGTCPTAYDGTELVVSWRGDGERRSASSCEVAFPPQDPLPTTLRALLSRIPRHPG